MGYSIAWLAVGGRAAADIQRQLGLIPTGRFADYGVEALVARTLPSNWYIIVARGCDHPIATARIAGLASQDATVLTGSVEEHVMAFSTAFWRGGEKFWEVARSGEADVNGLSVVGAPPADLEDLRKLYQAKQESDPDVDYTCEVPMALCQRICGFKYDEVIPGVEDASFEIMALSAGSPVRRRPWWRLWG
jgi:hypothetical protein